jgi:nitroimidazol reductase NimA-like FMN-containing flavoprotein (pyridoxamine 5'-phosphate oxidase superfamily)
MSEEFAITDSELDEETCWRMLARASVGRIGFVDGDDVVVLPINAAVHKRRVIFRTTAGSSLAGAQGAKVAFETDHTDQVAESGWSVVVRGVLRDVTDDPEVETWRSSMVHPWAPPPRDRWMMIEPHVVTGRMIERHRVIRRGEHVPYMPPD